MAVSGLYANLVYLFISGSNKKIIGWYFSICFAIIVGIKGEWGNFPLECH